MHSPHLERLREDDVFHRVPRSLAEKIRFSRPQPLAFTVLMAIRDSVGSVGHRNRARIIHTFANLPAMSKPLWDCTHSDDLTDRLRQTPIPSTDTGMERMSPGSSLARSWPCRRET